MAETAHQRFTRRKFRDRSPILMALCARFDVPVMLDGVPPCALETTMS